jgi:hypothetical protein
MYRTRKILILASAIGLMAMPAMAGVIVLPANEITFNPPLDTLNPAHSGYWWNPEFVFQDDTCPPSTPSSSSGTIPWGLASPTRAITPPG